MVSLQPSTISSSSENESEPEGNENNGDGVCGSGLPPPTSLSPPTSSYRTAAMTTSHDHSEVGSLAVQVMIMGFHIYMTCTQKVRREAGQDVS